MTKLKALSFIQARDYTREKYGLDAADRVKEALSKEAREVLYSELLLPGDWVDVRLAVEHTVVLDQLLGDGDGKLAADLVREIAASHFKGLYRVMFLLASPRSVLEKSSRLWPRYYDQGESPVVIHTDGHATSQIVGCPDMPQHHEWLVLPYVEEVLRQAGAKDVTAEHLQCVADGAEFCATDVRWK
jgi:hypothetical protein